jgi:hypothetical protein
VKVFEKLEELGRAIPDDNAQVLEARESGGEVREECRLRLRRALKGEGRVVPDDGFELREGTGGEGARWSVGRQRNESPIARACDGVTRERG